MKKVWILMLCFSIFFSGCSKNQNISSNETSVIEVNSDNKNQSTPYNEDLIVKAYIDYSYYDNLEYLHRKTTIIIDGTVVKKYSPKGVNITLSEGAPGLYQIVTKYDIKVSDSIKGKYKKDDLIKLQVSGGEFEGKFYDYGLRQFEEEDNMIFFLRDFPQKPDYPAVLINDCQGTIQIESNKLKVNSQNKLFSKFNAKDKNKLIDELRSKLEN